MSMFPQALNLSSEPHSGVLTPVIAMTGHAPRIEQQQGKRPRLRRKKKVIKNKDTRTSLLPCSQEESVLVDSLLAAHDVTSAQYTHIADV